MAKEIIQLNSLPNGKEILEQEGSDARAAAAFKVITGEASLEASGKTPKKALQTLLGQSAQAEMGRLDALRKGTQDTPCVDVSLGEYVKMRYGIGGDDAVNTYMELLGINVNRHTIAALTTQSEFNPEYRFLVPEIIREALRAGISVTPLYPELIRGTESIPSSRVTMPEINMSNVQVSRLSELESIRTGTMSFGQKIVEVSEYGMGLELSDKVIRETPLNLLAIYLEDAGSRLQATLDRLAVEAMLNGDATDSSDSIGVIGVATANTLSYADLLKAIIRMARINGNTTGMLVGEGMANTILQMDEFKKSNQYYANGQNPSNAAPVALGRRNFNIPATQDLFMTSFVPSNYVVIFNRLRNLLKLDVQALRIETDRRVAERSFAYYATVTTGFATMFRDARLAIDRRVAFSSNGFPSWMDVDAYMALMAALDND